MVIRGKTSTTEKSVMDSKGFLTIRWPQKVKKQTDLDDFDVLISTVTLPTMYKGRYPTTYQIANSMNKAEYYNYFLNNRKNGIITFQDERILKGIQTSLSKI